VLNAQRLGRPLALCSQPFYAGINDALSPGFNPRALENLGRLAISAVHRFCGGPLTRTWRG
jgi:hypothetical protein